MSTLVLCSKKGDFNESSVLLSEVTYESDLDSFDGDEFEHVVVTCDVSKWENAEWYKISSALTKSGMLYVKKSKTLDFFTVFRFLGDYFVPWQETESYHILMRCLTLGPEIVRPEVIAELMKEEDSLDRLFENSHVTKICLRLDAILREEEVNNRNIDAEPSDRYIGGGSEGSVYQINDWWSGVVIKVIQNVEMREGKPYNGKYTTSIFTEVYGASLLSRLLDSTSDDGFLYHVQRYAGFFTCGEDKQHNNLYLLSEKMEGDIAHFCTVAKSMQELKVILWQCIFTLVCLNKLEYYHNDPSAENFLYRRVPHDEIYEGTKVGSSESWTYKLSDEIGEREWKLPNIELVAKITDFGYLTHLRKPILFTTENRGIHRDERTPQGYNDVNFFLMSLFMRAYSEYGMKFKFDLDPLFDEWFRILGINVDNLSAGIGFINELKQLGIIYDTKDFTSRYDSWDPLRLLDGEFFADILLK
uniref:Protein kinase domain-containing protein n=1 Tax=viral metagenome TaxID=1070528 RepID=A0A6C0CIW8_9ZZZZ